MMPELKSASSSAQKANVGHHFNQKITVSWSESSDVRSLYPTFCITPLPSGLLHAKQRELRCAHGCLSSFCPNPCVKVSTRRVEQISRRTENSLQYIIVVDCNACGLSERSHVPVDGNALDAGEATQIVNCLRTDPPNLQKLLATGIVHQP